MTESELIDRTKRFALRVMNVVRALPKKVEGRVIADQLMRSDTSVRANYRAACKARSHAEFISKLGTVEEEEADETASWLELLIDGGVISQKRLQPLLLEARELVEIFAASRKTAGRNARSQIANRKLQIPDSARSKRRRSKR